MPDVLVDFHDPVRVAAGVEIVDPFPPTDDLVISVGRKVDILPAAADQERPRGDQRRHERKVVLIGVVELDAVALARRDPMLRLRAGGPRRAHRDGGRHALIIVIHAYVGTTDYEEFLEVGEQINLGVVELTLAS